MDYLNVILTSSLFGALASGLFFFLFKTWVSERLKNAIKHEYDQKLETHKAQIKAEADVTIERLKSELHILAMERQVQFSRVFEKTAEVVATTYQKLLSIHQAVAEYTSLFEWTDTPPREDRRKIVGERQREFLDFFLPNRLYFSQPMVTKINEFTKQMNKTAVTFMTRVEQGGDSRDPHSSTDTWVETDKYMTEEAPVLLRQLEDEFRSILGLRTEEK